MITASGKTSQPRVAVIGGGVIGLTCALELRRGGANICVYDREPGPAGGTSGRAAGMLGSSFEASGPPAMLRFMERSARAWPDFAAWIGRDGGDIGYSDLPSIFCALAPEEAEGRVNPSIPLLEAAAIRTIEPAIDGPVVSGAVLQHDRQVDPGLLVGQLAVVTAAEGVDVRFNQAVERIECGAAFRTADGQEWDRVLVATGIGKPPVFVRGGEELDARLPPIVPVKGQMLALKPWSGAPRHVIRLANVYIVPKKRWVLVGATEEPSRSDETIEPHVLARLRAEAAKAVSGIARAEQAAAWAGIRPGTKDGVPVIGETAIPSVFAAMGHYRNGILLAPETARMIAGQMLEGRAEKDAAAFSPMRFDK